MFVDSLPTELLSQIFSASGPLLASHVSHKWRAVSLGDPRLWDSPSLEITYKTPVTSLDLMDLWLERSSSQPLHVTLKILEPMQRGFAKRFIRQLALDALTLLQKHAARFKTLTLVIPSLLIHEVDFYELCTGFGALPNLQAADITLGCWKGGEPQRLSAAYTLFSRMPVMRDLRWRNHRSWGMWDSNFASGVELLWTAGVWAPLTTLVLDTFITLEGALDVLTHCTLLEHLELARYSERPPDFETFPTALSSLLGNIANGGSPPPTIPAIELYKDTAPLYLPSLRALTIYQYTLDTALHGLFSRIVCTSLTHLSITCGFLPGPHAAADAQPHAAGEALVAFLVRSHAPVESLHLESIGLSVAHVESCLQALSSTLVRLEVHNTANLWCIDDLLLRELTVCGELNLVAEKRGRHAAVLCPKMHTLVLHRAINCMNGVLAEMVRSRLEGYKSGLPTSKLDKVDVVFSKQQQAMNSVDIEFLRALHKHN